MKITKTFENAILRTVNRGYIELDYNGKTECFYDASVVSVNNGTITIKVDWKPEKGELIKITGNCTDSYTIFDSIDERLLRTFGYKRITGTSYKLHNDFWFMGSETKISPVTIEEQQAFDDFCKSQGKIWNKEKLQWEKLRWKPDQGTVYFHIFIVGDIVQIGDYIWVDDATDKNYYEMGNCFKTRAEAEAKLEQIKQILNSTI